MAQRKQPCTAHCSWGSSRDFRARPLRARSVWMETRWQRWQQRHSRRLFRNAGGMRQRLHSIFSANLSPTRFESDIELELYGSRAVRRNVSTRRMSPRDGCLHETNVSITIEVTTACADADWVAPHRHRRTGAAGATQGADGGCASATRNPKSLYLRRLHGGRRPPSCAQSGNWHWRLQLHNCPTRTKRGAPSEAAQSAASRPHPHTCVGGAGRAGKIASPAAGAGVPRAAGRTAGWARPPPSGPQRGLVWEI
jgi:hypothetical protein